MYPPRRLAFIAAGGFILLAFLVGYHFTSSGASTASSETGNFYSFRHTKHEEKQFHLIFPATGPNLDFCKLLLSAGILGYPEPIFVGWEGRGVYNGTESHLFKITETLTYLRSLPASADEDMVLILDAYDIWLQLRPEVLISRYYDVIRKNDDRLRDEGIYGKKLAGDKVQHSIIFGPDKIFWPQGPGHPAVWAVPQSYLPENAFGPETDTNMLNVRPRWLNSGTIMGPAKEMRELFSATMDQLSRHYDAGWEFHGSDQYYFAEVWAEQEINRMKLRDDGVITPPDYGDDVEVTIPDIPEGKKTEYGICLDYEMDLFQTAAAFEFHVLWMRFNGSNPAYGDSTSRIDQWTLREDVARSAGPFAAAPKEFPEQKSWKEMHLGANSITHAPFGLFHVTGDKTVRDRWWPRMWFHPHGEALMKASKRKLSGGKKPATFADVNGVKWTQARPDGKTKPMGPGKDEKGGAWRDDGVYIPWKDMCAPFEDDRLYLRQPKGEL
ncbi:hypothetical protein PRZ48_013930 [Zasmidium cellare]|uniref:Uncharacterized protein n=1 Tax=Zasmidium cellare TaxID=395010 RepID=A0ABR0DZI0_ZASCE|nr:hypothetical protein PRZ48_013930 [Zasmidium cellare]